MTNTKPEPPALFQITAQGQGHVIRALAARRDY